MYEASITYKGVRCMFGIYKRHDNYYEDACNDPIER